MENQTVTGERTDGSADQISGWGGTDSSPSKIEEIGFLCASQRQGNANFCKF